MLQGATSNCFERDIRLLSSRVWQVVMGLERTSAADTILDG